MRLDDIAIVAAETNRSQVYLQALVQYELYPNFVLVMVNPDRQRRPGQKEIESQTQIKTTDQDETLIEQFDIKYNPAETVVATLQRSGIPYLAIESADINSDPVYYEITHRNESVFIYSGYGGGILKKRVLSCGKRWLHVHGGYLPDYKGSTTNYYSLLRENCCGASSLWLESKIDAGPILLRHKVEAPQNRKSIDYDFDSLLRARVLLDTIEGYLTNGMNWNFGVGVCTGGETYYIMHPLLRHIAVLGDPALSGQ